MGEKITTVSKPKWKKWRYLIFLQITLMSGVIENSQIILSASSFDLLPNRMSHNLWNTPIYTLDRIRVKKENTVSILITKIVLISGLRRALGILRTLDHTLGGAGLDSTTVFILLSSPSFCYIFWNISALYQFCYREWRALYTHSSQEVNERIATLTYQNGGRFRTLKGSTPLQG